MTYFSLISFAAILLVSSSAIYLSSATPEEILKTICFSSRQSATCMCILKSDPRTASADLPQLSPISIKLAMKQADSNTKDFAEIIANSTNPQIKRRCSPCIGVYHDIKSLLQEAEFDDCLHLATKCAALCSVNSIALDQLS